MSPVAQVLGLVRAELARRVKGLKRTLYAGAVAALFLPLRLAITGRPAGPELADLLPLLGREGTLARQP